VGAGDAGGAGGGGNAGDAGGAGDGDAGRGGGRGRAGWRPWTSAHGRGGDGARPGGRRPGALVGGLDLEYFEREVADEVGLEPGAVIGRHGVPQGARPRPHDERALGGPRRDGG
jgi:hypothetical protein